MFWPAPMWVGDRVAWEIEGVRSRDGTWIRSVNAWAVERVGVLGVKGIADMRRAREVRRRMRVCIFISGF